MPLLRKALRSKWRTETNFSRHVSYVSCESPCLFHLGVVCVGWVVRKQSENLVCACHGITSCVTPGTFAASVHPPAAAIPAASASHCCPGTWTVFRLALRCQPSVRGVYGHAELQSTHNSHEHPHEHPHDCCGGDTAAASMPVGCAGAMPARPEGWRPRSTMASAKVAPGVCPPRERPQAHYCSRETRSRRSGARYRHAPPLDTRRLPRRARTPSISRDRRSGRAGYVPCASPLPSRNEAAKGLGVVNFVGGPNGPYRSGEVRDVALMEQPHHAVAHRRQHLGRVASADAASILP